jgi:hypothetical protein
MPSLVYEGLGYFLVLAGKNTFLWLNTTSNDVPSGVNVFNTIYYHTNNVQNQVSRLTPKKLGALISTRSY